jgi:hypothetical protein
MANGTRLKGLRVGQHHSPVRNPFITYMGCLSYGFDRYDNDARSIVERIQQRGSIGCYSLGENVDLASPASRCRQKPHFESPPQRTAAEHRAERERLKQIERENDPMWGKCHYVPMWAEPPEAEPKPAPVAQEHAVNTSCPLDQITSIVFHGHNGGEVVTSRADLMAKPREPAEVRAERIVRSHVDLSGVATYRDLVEVMARSDVPLNIENAQAALKAYYRLRKERETV